MNNAGGSPNFRTSHVNLIAYAVIVTVLIGLAIVDVTQILKDYLHDNTYTLIKLENVNGTLPFIDNPTICAYYDDHSIFPELWNMSESERKEKRNWKRWFARVSANDSRLFGRPSADLTLQERIDIALFSELIFELEFDGIHFFNKYFLPSTGLNKTVANEVLDKFISSPFSKAFIDKVGKDVLPRIIYNYSVTPPEYILDNLTFPFVCYTIRLDEYLTQNHPRKFEFGSLKKYVNGSLNVASVNVVTVDFPDFGIAYEGQIDKTAPSVSIRIVNTGRVDRSLVKSCTNLFNTESECLQDLKWRTLSEVCGCTPFFHLIFMDKNRKLKPNRQLPICTTRMYESCYDQAVREWEKREKSQVCQPCVLSKNKYVDIYEIPNPDARGLIVTFQCTDSFFVVFQEKQQFSFPQLVSQIGGDLGLYTGFSMISLIHFAVALYNVYQSRRVSDGNIPKGKHRWSHLITRHFYAHRHHHDGDSHGHAGIHQLQQKIELLENRLKAFEKRQRSEPRVDTQHIRQMLEATAQDPRGLNISVD